MKAAKIRKELKVSLRSGDKRRTQELIQKMIEQFDQEAKQHEIDLWS